ncbi:MAG: hypothetical protein ACYC2K_07400 [Gemmatimonadales bacterium]
MTRTTTPYGEGIYVASRVKQAPLWRMFRTSGAPIISTWIDEAGDGETADFGELWQRIRGEIASSKALVFYADGVGDFPFKGALVEVGMALAMGKPVFAALENVMLDGRTMRPVGSWLLDRNVHRCDTVAEALDRAQAVGKHQSAGVECSECRRLNNRLYKIDAALDELNAPKHEQVAGLTMELSRVGRIKRLQSASEPSIEDAVRAEREACAQVLQAKHEELAKRSYPPPAILLTMAEAIRARNGTADSSSKAPDNVGDSDRWQDPRDISGGATDAPPSTGARDG